MDERDLGEALKETLALLDGVRETFWASKIRGALQSGDLDEILSWYGGMGSFNDLLIATANGHQVSREQEPAKNAQLRQLQTQIYERTRRLMR
ncbi:MAG TPA: hypothetical protein VGG39_11105 [Polyangiaceae bacterium]|jgi:hypothetical protein